MQASSVTFLKAICTLFSVYHKPTVLNNAINFKDRRKLKGKRLPEVNRKWK